MTTKLGLDWWDVGIHVLVTLLAAVALSEEGPPGKEGVTIPMLFAGSAVVLA